MKPSNLKPIPSFPGFHADPRGRIWSTRRGKPKLIRQRNSHGDGWYRVNIEGADGKVKFRTTASLILEAFAGPRPTGCIPFHRDGDPGNDAADNLVWRTRGEVVSQRHRLDLNSSKVDALVAGLADLVRRLRNDEAVTTIARAHKVNRCTVERIRATLLGLSRKPYRQRKAA
jgi:hypothetical protein